MAYKNDEQLQAWAQRTHARDFAGALRFAAGVAQDPNGISRLFYGTDSGFADWSKALAEAPTPTARVKFWSADQVSSGFTRHAVSNAGGTETVGAGPGGDGVVFGGQASADDDRRIFLLNGVTASDVEVRATHSTNSGGAQFGVCARASASMCATGWTNALFGANASALAGFWQYDGTALAATNQMSASANANGGVVVSAAGDGSMITCVSDRPHFIRTTQGIRLTVTGVADTALTATRVDPYTFTVPSTVSGALGPGTWRVGSTSIPTGRVRTIALRLVGTESKVKQWQAGEPEPSWDDSVRVATNTIPDTLSSGAVAPNASGGVGIIVAHFGTGGTRTVRVHDLEVRVL